MEEKKELGAFDLFWDAYPIRKGDRAKQPAKALFEKLTKTTPADQIIQAAKRYAAEESTSINTPYIMQAQRWLRNKRWLDYPELQLNSSNSVPSGFFIREGTPQWTAWQKVKKTPCVNFGWWFPAEWPSE